MEPILIASILLAAAIALLLADLFIPSGGVLLILSGLAAVGSILFAFRSSTSAGLTFVILVLGSLPIFIGIFLKVWPHTSIGKRLLGRLPEKTEYQWSSVQDMQNVKSLIGCLGKTVTEMMPSGLVEIDGKRFESLTEGRTISLGRAVRVLRVEMGRLVVAESEGIPSINENVRKPKGDPTKVDEQASLLDRPIEELGLESLSDEDVV